MAEADSWHDAVPVVVFANDWATDPTSKHHLMPLLARRNPVLWVEASGMRRPRATSGADWRRIGLKIRRMTGGLRRIAPRLAVLSPPAIPLPGSAWARAINARLYRWSIRRALRKLGATRPPVLWVYIPTVARYLDQLPAVGLVYHCIDRWWAFSDFDPDEMRACHEILCRRADHVFASARELADECATLTPRVSYVPHGVDWAHFRRAITLPHGRPDDLGAADRPIAGFIGLLDEWVDLELLARVAAANPQADVVVIGAARIPTDGLARMPNVRLLGRKPFADLPAYLAHFDVTLIPFRVNDLTTAVNPIKLREYLSAGVPVVTTALPEMLAFRGWDTVDVAENADEFVAAVTHRLEAPIAAPHREALSAAMRGDGWEGRLEQMLAAVGPLL